MTNSSLTKTFFEKFELFADAPGAVAKMRELVLELAVQGNLVDQRQCDGNAGQILAAIATERNSRDGKLRTPIQTFPSDDDLFEIPENWVWTQLGNIALQIQYGYNASADHLATDVRMLRITDIQSDRVDWSSVPGCQIDENDLGKYLLIRNDILIARTGGTIGKSFIVLDVPPKSVFASYLIRVTPPRSIDARYVKVFLGSPFYWKQLREMSAGTGQPNVNGQALGRLRIPLPPLAEQNRIVAKVDELMALCDRLEDQQQERETRHATLARASLARFADAPTPANLDFLFHKSYGIDPADLRKSILTLAVQGKLVPQDPNDEPAEECLSRLGLKSTAIPPGSEDEDDTLPPSWVRVRFEDVALIAGGVTLGRKLGDRKTVNLPYLRVANVKRGEIDLSVVKEVAIAENEIERYALRENDLLMTEGGDWDKVGRAAIWRAEIPVCLHQNHVFRARMRSNELTPIWFERYFNSPMGRGYFESASKQTTNLASINMRQVRNCPIPFPPVAEQRRIVAKVEELMALVDELETQLTTSRTTASRLLEAIVAELTDSKGV